MVFETLEADQFQFSDSIQNVLSSEGLQTGIVLDIGEINCQSAAIYEGHQTCYKYLNGISGRHICDKFAEQYAQMCNVYFTKSSERELIVRDIKEQCC